VGLLLIILIFGMIVRFGLQPQQFQGHEGAQRLLTISLVAEIICTGLILVGLAWVGLPPALPRRAATVRAATWSVAAPVLLLLLGLNYAYTHLLQDFLHLPMIDKSFLTQKDLLLLTLLTICLQPAIVEELFFRYLALGTLRRATSTQGAVLISAVMFGMAHVDNLLGIPYLIVLGIVLGSMRVASGSLVLPMLMHLGHNLAVLYMK
jgi:membrane protease YdiL (CAAX protease family)